MSRNQIVITVIGLGVILVIAIIVAAVRRERKRKAAIRAAASDLGLEFREKAPEILDTLSRRFGMFKRGHSRRVHNVLEGQIEDIGVAIFDYRYTTGGGEHQSTSHQTVVLLRLAPGNDLPALQISPENVFHKLASGFGFSDIDFDEHPEFSDKYLVKGKDEDRIRALLTPRMMEALCAHPKRPSIQAEGELFVYWRSGKRVKPEQLDDLLRDAFEGCPAIA